MKLHLMLPERQNSTGYTEDATHVAHYLPGHRSRRWQKKLGTEGNLNMLEHTKVIPERSPAAMSTPFYARYIPPSIPKIEAPASVGLEKGGPSKKRKRNSAPPLESITAGTIAGNPSIKTKERVYPEEDEKIKQFKKKNKSDSTAAHNEVAERTWEDSTHGSWQRAAACIEKGEVQGLESKKKKKKKRISGGQELGHAAVKSQDVEPEEAQAVVEETKHKKIRSKFEKSIERAARLAEKGLKTKDSEAPEEDELEAPIETHGLVPLPQPEQVPDTVERPTFSALPPWLANPIVVTSSDSTPFQSLPISPAVLASLEKKGYSEAFAIQLAVLPLLLPGPEQDSGDVCISASTGSGKTLSYVLPMVESLRGKPVTRLRGLIIVPTRELVSQVRETCELCAAGMGLKIGTAVGSKSMREEQYILIRREQRYDPEGYRAIQDYQISDEEWLMNWNIEELYGKGDEFMCLPDFVEDLTSNVDILICTPGRLVDHLQSTRGFTLKHVEWLAIDEADRLLDQSFQQWIDIVMPALHAQEPLDPMEELVLKELHIKKPRQIRKIVLSATMTRDISKLASLRLSRPKMVVLDSSRTAEHVANQEIGDSQNLIEGELPDPHATFDLPTTLKEVAIAVRSGEDKPLYLIRLLADHKTDHAVGLPSKLSSGRAIKARSNSSLDDSTDNSSSDDHRSSTSSNDPTSSPSTSESDVARIKSSPPTSSMPSTYGTLVFTNNNENALRLARLLVLLDPLWESRIGTLTGSSATSSGRRTLTAFRKRKLSILVASDRASRGLDIQDLAHVINYDLPVSLTSYVHRVGRTARAGKEGTATTFVAHREARWFWNEIARSEHVKRGPGKKVLRMELNLEAGDKEKKRYEEALRQLGREARGEAA